MTRQYKTRDPEKTAMLQCAGAKLINKIIDEHKKIIFVLEHENIDEMVDKIHNGEPLILHNYIQYQRKLMNYIKDYNLNRKKDNVKKGDAKHE